MTKRKKALTYMRAEIFSGKYGPGAVIPPVYEMAWNAGVSTSTASAAFAILKGQGIVSSKPGQRAVMKARVVKRIGDPFNEVLIGDVYFNACTRCWDLVKPESWDRHTCRT